jgi:hypothetical protein
MSRKQRKNSYFQSEAPGARKSTSKEQKGTASLNESETAGPAVISMTNSKTGHQCLTMTLSTENDSH